MGIFDSFILINAISSFLTYFFIQFYVFRVVSLGDVLKWLLRVVLAGGALNIMVSLFYFCTNSPIKIISISEKILYLILSLAIYGLMTFLYILMVFGTYESSIRLRLIREIYRDFPKRTALKEILVRYNARVILQGRLERLTSSGDLSFDGKSYHYINRQNIFSIIDLISSFLKKIYRLK